MDFTNRIRRLQSLVAENRLDLFIVSSQESIYYLTGVSYQPLERPFFILIRPAGSPELLVPAMERAHLAAGSGFLRVKQYWDFPAPPSLGWSDMLRILTINTKRIGVEPTMPVGVFQELFDRNFRVLPLVETLRQVKDSDEVKMLRHAARYATMGIKKILASVYPGVSVLELFGQGRNIQMAMIREVGYDAVMSSVLVGAWPAPGSAMPHYIPSPGDHLEEGPHIALALIRSMGYCAECERTFFLEKPLPEIQDAFEAMLEARRRGFAMIKPGVPCGEIDVKIKDFLIAQGYEDNLLHRTGHGFGLSNHEEPWVAEGSREILKAGMLVSIEPGLYFPGIGGIRHSDTVLVTGNGHEVLTPFPTEFNDLVIKANNPFKRIAGNMVRRAAGIQDRHG
ncbi:MAG: M24 family metallopeptidase [Chitinophagales bacterium]